MLLTQIRSYCAFKVINYLFDINTTNDKFNNYILYCIFVFSASNQVLKTNETGMWANAQRDGRPAEYRWPDGDFLAIFACRIFSEPHAARFRPAF